MKFDYKTASKERNQALMNEGQWTLNILTHFLFISSVAGSKVDDQLTEPNCDLTDLDLKLTANGIEINLEKGLNRIVGALNQNDDRESKIKELIYEFQNKISEIR